MKIVLAAPYIVNSRTTLEIIFSGLGEAYKKSGYHVCGLALDNLDGRSGMVIKKDWGDFHLVNCAGKTMPGAAIALFFQAFRLLDKEDLVHLHLENWSLCVLSLWLACKAKKVSIGVTFDGLYSLSGAPSQMELTGLKYIALSASWVTTISNFMTTCLSHAIPALSKRLRLVSSGLPAVQTDAIKKDASDSGRPFVLCIARLTKYKGIDLLLMAWHDICRDISGIDLVLGGPDASSGYFQKLASLLGISERVKFLGYVERNDYWTLMRSCLIFCLPSRIEPFGHAALEALACGKPVLTTRCGGVEDFITDGVNGILTTPGDVVSLGQKLSCLIQYPELRARISAEALKTASGFSWDKSAAAYLALWHQDNAQARSFPPQ
ncbi:MAG: glycosyltransferase family 4 protein [Elusimicrobiota bacterium]